MTFIRTGSRMMTKNTTASQDSLVIPAYNEENRITLLFDAIPYFEGELIVVCDGTDETADIIDRIAAERKDLTIRCFRFDHRLGKGGGVMAGLKAAHSSCAGYFDADGSTTIGEMMRLLSCLKESDCVIGSRWVPGIDPHREPELHAKDREPYIQPDHQDPFRP